MLKKIVATGLLAGVLLPSLALAENYQYEVGVMNGSGEYNGSDEEFTAFYGSYYLDSVDTSAGPYGAASFLDKASDISLVYIGNEIDTEDGDEDSTFKSLSGRFVADGGVIAEIAASRYDDPGFTEYSFGLGAYIGDNSELVGSFSTVSRFNTDTFSLRYYGVYPVGDSAHIAPSAEYTHIEYEDGSNGSASDLGLALFLGKKLSVEYSIFEVSYDDYTGRTSIAELQYFVVPSFNLGVSRVTYGGDDEGDATSVTAEFRF